MIRAGFTIAALALAVALGFPACARVFPESAQAVSGPLETARTLARSDLRIEALLAPLPKAASGESDRNRGFDVQLTSPGSRDHDARAIGLRMPQVATEALRVGAGSEKDLQAILTPRATGGQANAGMTSAAAPAELRDGIIAYRDVYRDTDMLAAAERGQTELLFLLRTPAAPKRFAWNVQLPTGIGKVESRNDGVWFLDRRGDLVMHMPEPYCVDANGVKRSALLTWNESTFELALELTSDAGLTYPILLDPAFETEVWVEVQDPPVSTKHQAIYDEARQRVVLFGGDIPAVDTWLYDGLAWRKRTSRSGEVKPDHPISAWDSRRRRIVAVGSDGITATWDGAMWREEESVPASTSGATLTEDVASGTLVLFGGDPGSNDTWVWNGMSWNKYPGPPRLLGRTQHTVTWDPARNQLVLFGGSHQMMKLSDTWTWSGTEWKETGSGVTPTPRANHTLTWDESLQVLVAFGGDGLGSEETWEWNGRSWALASSGGPPARHGHTMGWDRNGKQLVLVGGEGPFSTSRPDPWLRKSGVWAKAAGVVPQPRTDHTMTWDAARQTFVLFGGYEHTQAGDLRSNDTWLMHLSSWLHASGGPQPVAREGHSVTWDPERKQLMLFGGERGYSQALNDTWVWQGNSWATVAGGAAGF
jgi:hypothetical protein